MLDSNSQKELFHSRVLLDFLKAPTFRNALKASNLAKAQARVENYKQFSGSGINRLPFQDRAVQSACLKRNGLWCGELWTGSGKSIIAARIALSFLAHGGKVIFICPNRTGIGNIADGIIQKFHRTFEHFKAPYRIGALDDVTRLDDVQFFTPHAFVRMSGTDPAFFKKITSEASLLLVDEAHHFPEDPEEEQVIYGKIERLASSHLLNSGKKVVTLTATHGRHDGKPVFTKAKPDFQITVSEAVQAGWCPEIHGLPVYLNTKAPKAVRVASEYTLNLTAKAKAKYLRQVVAVMLQVQKENPGQQFCAFVRTIPEAWKLAEIWNYEAPGLGFLPVATLIGTMSTAERMATKRAIQLQEYAGYITCDVGAESIDIPRLETVHLIRRTRSVNRIVQSIGRVLRNHPEKRRALIVDYHLSEKKIIRACQGLETYAAYVKSSAKKLISGGPLVPIPGSKNADFTGITLQEERKWVEQSLLKNTIKSGSKFRWLTVVEDGGPDKVECLCKCGNTFTSRRIRLLNGLSISCGCYKKSNAVISKGSRFGKLTVLKYESPYKVVCKCDCGKTAITAKGGLVTGTTKSCGCIRAPYGPLKKGRRIGKLTVLEDLGSSNVRCRCDCGKVITINRFALRTSTRFSCGCSRGSTGAPIRKGARFGSLKVISDAGSDSVLCRCKCGKDVRTTRSLLRGGDKTSCGCIRLSYIPEKHREKIKFLGGSAHRIRSGASFEWLTAIKDLGCSKVKCRCRCGKTIVANRSYLLRGKTKSCGCRGLRDPLKNGTLYGRLKVISDGGKFNVRCLCKCGKIVVLKRTVLTSGNTKSCGCLLHGVALRRGRRFGMLRVVKDLGPQQVRCKCDCGKVTDFVRSNLVFQRKSCGCMRRKNLPAAKVGRRFGAWTVLGSGNKHKVYCLCDCGSKKTVSRKTLYAGASRSCGCKNLVPTLSCGKVFKRLTVMEDKGNRLSRSVLCKCLCGKTKRVRRESLVSGRVSSCGCRNGLPHLKKGRRFGRLLVVEDNGGTRVVCKCNCGKLKITNRTNLRRGYVKSCGCLAAPYGPLKPGAKYGGWVVLKDAGCLKVMAKCSCGIVRLHPRANLRSGLSKSCNSCAQKMRSKTRVL